MICPLCGSKDNFPGQDECGFCQFPLCSVDRPVPIDRIDRSLMYDSVSVLNPRPAITLPLGSSLGQAMRLMLRERVGALLILDDEQQLCGILTERDFLTKIAGRSDAEGLPVLPWMTPNPETVRPTDLLASALGKMMVGRYRHLPVVEGQHPLGMISVRDILRHILEHC